MAEAAGVKVNGYQPPEEWTLKEKYQHASILKDHIDGELVRLRDAMFSSHIPGATEWKLVESITHEISWMAGSMQKLKDEGIVV